MDRVIQRIASTSTWSPHHATFYQDGRVIRLGLTELDAMARRAARWLRGLGAAPGDRIGICARNRLEWVLLDLAALKLRVVTAGFEHGAFQLDEECLRRYGLKRIFTDGVTDADGFVDIRRVTAELPESPLEQEAVAYADDDVTTIKFTSGSTGRPKGLAATVGSIDSSIDAVQELFHHGADDKLLVFLPLSLLQQRYWIYSAFYYGHDVVVTGHEFAVYACKQERPTVVMGVPSFFDALKAQIEAKAAAQTPPDADGAERLRALRRCAGDMLGGRIRYLWTGSAPAKHEMLRFFEDCGLAIYEGYGMNETCIVTKNAPSAHRPGSVGKVLKRKEILIDEDGVLIVRSQHPVNRRYLFCDGEEAQRIFRDNGDVVTGDLAHIDEDGYLYIRGRADDIISLSNGKNVFARPIEDLAKRCPAIEECVLFGAGRPHLVAVISPAASQADGDAIGRHIAWVNAQVSGHERIGAFIVADDRFSTVNGLLTSQGKPRRARIKQAYERRILQAYGET
ncbi:AMP-binding protein [Sorangium sp. So ce513]|uniref:AMP-binding protein n=1 Tax=Sorangium sp. So ce513 TaxID=3133315 RepID=UPI003F63DC0E